MKAKKHILRLIGILIAMPLWADAKPGEQEYQAYCLACHGDKGQGGVNFSAPPLAESAWVQGEAERAIKVVLNGLKGNIEVDGHVYTALMMPPQGAVLSDKQIADILSYVRTSWGNKSGKVKPAAVAKVRKEIDGIEPFYEASELLKQHPLPKVETALRGLLVETYLGEWNKLPDFSKLKSEGLEEEHSNIISFRNISHRKNFGLVWTGQFENRKRGGHKFILQADDGAKLIINGKEVAKIDGIGDMKRVARAEHWLKKGLHDIRVEYFQKGGDRGISLYWEGPNNSKGGFLTDKVKDIAPVHEPIVLKPPGSEAFIYRNFIEGVSPRAIAVGYPGGKSIAFSQDDCTMVLMWKSGFIDAGLHWTGRGKGFTKPVGEGLVSLSSGSAFGLDVNFLRMEHDEHRYPTFVYQAGDYTIEDKPLPSENGIKRVLKIHAQKAGKLIYPLNAAALETIAIECEGKAKLKESAIEMTLKSGVNTYTINYIYK